MKLGGFFEGEMKCILPESRVRLPAERSRGMCSAAFNEINCVMLLIHDCRIERKPASLSTQRMF